MESTVIVAIRQRAEAAQRLGVFKTASVGRVLWRMIWPSERMGKDALQDASLVDTFISHSHSQSSGWMKALAVCFHFNLDLAVASTALAWILAMLLSAWRAGRLTAIADEGLLHLGMLYICFPVIVFVIMFFGGHVLRQRSLWFDQVCISDATPFAKFQTLQSIPAFVASSNELLVLWDESVLDRLWCIYEISTFARTSGSDRMHIVPTWLPLWTLMCMLGFGIGIIPSFVAPMPLAYNKDSSIELFLSVSRIWLSNYTLFFFSAIPVSCLSMVKLRSHGAMLQQMAWFDFRSAKCSLETDRLVIEKHVVALFDEALEAPVSVAFGAEVEPFDESKALLAEDIEAIRSITSYPTKDEIIDEFNDYVRGPLRDSVMDRLGREADLSARDCITACLVALLQVSVWVLGCDGFQCKESKMRIGFSSVELYMVVNLIQNSFAIPVYVATIALLLKVNAWIASRVVRTGPQMLCAVFSAIIVQGFEFTLLSVLAGAMSVVATRCSVYWLLCSLACMILVGGQLWLLFRRQAQSSPSATVPDGQ